MENLLDEDLYDKKTAYAWWKSKRILFNFIMIATGMVFLYFEFEHYKMVADTEYEYFSPKTTITYMLCFSLAVFCLGNFIHMKIGNSLKGLKYNKKLVVEKFLQSITYSLFLELLFFFVGLQMASIFGMAYYT